MKQEDWLEQAQRRRQTDLFDAGWRKGNGKFRGEQLWVSPDGKVFLPESEATRHIQGGDDAASAAEG